MEKVKEVREFFSKCGDMETDRDDVLRMSRKRPYRSNEQSNNEKLQTDHVLPSPPASALFSFSKSFRINK